MTLPSNATTVTVRNVALPLDYAQKPGDEPLRLAVSRKLRIPARAVLEARLLKRSVDARHKDDVRFVATMEAHVDADALRAAHLSGDVAVAELTGMGIMLDSRAQLRPRPPCHRSRSVLAAGMFPDGVRHGTRGALRGVGAGSCRSLPRVRGAWRKRGPAPSHG